jgi:hypothetical protein
MGAGPLRVRLHRVHTHRLSFLVIKDFPLSKCLITNIPSFLFFGSTKMSLSLALSIPFVISLIVAPSLGAIGPTADLEIVNMDVSPDGYSRSAISAGGEGVVGSLITANMGDTISINIINSLDDDNMLEATSIVSDIGVHSFQS